MVIATMYEVDSVKDNIPRRNTSFCGKFTDFDTAVKELGLENIEPKPYEDGQYTDFDVEFNDYTIIGTKFYTIIDLDKVEENVITKIGVSVNDWDEE